MKNNTRLIVLSAMFAALACVATMVIRIPSPFKGYLNLGDSVVLLSGWLLPPLFGALAAGLGSALADLFSGYATYVPATFLIKAGMALAAFGLYRLLSRKTKPFLALLLSGLAAEALMVLGYLAFESALYGFIPSLPNVLPNALQGAVGLTLGLSLKKLFDKSNLLTK